MSGRRHIAIVLGAAWLATTASVSWARPIYWAAVSQASSIEVIASALDGALTASASTTVSSASASRADLLGDAAPGVLSLVDGHVQLADRTLSVDLAEFGRIDAGISNLAARLPTGSYAPTLNYAGPPGYGRYDLSGAPLTIDGGLLTYSGTGSLGGLLGSGSLDFAAAPLSFFAPPGTTGHLLKSAPGPRGGEVVVFGVPLDIRTPVIQDPLAVDLRIRGQLVLYGFRAGAGGSLAVPEPASWALLTIGGAACVVAARRRRSSRSVSAA